MTIWRGAPSDPSVDKIAQRGAERNRRTGSIRRLPSLTPEVIPNVGLRPDRETAIRLIEEGDAATDQDIAEFAAAPRPRLALAALDRGREARRSWGRTPIRGRRLAVRYVST